MSNSGVSNLVDVLCEGVNDIYSREEKWKLSLCHKKLHLNSSILLKQS